MDGIIIINKEKNWTSNDIVQKIKHITHQKVGHAGTLDPFATGVLPILLGKGTLLSKYIINHDKKYLATVKLGIKTSTGDEEGKIIEKQFVKKETLEKEHIENCLKSFLGKRKQTPPMYSAIKVNGKKLYEYARKKEEILVSPRNIEIYDIKLINISKENDEITYEVSCSKGTYIRTLSEEIAEKIGTIGFTKALLRKKAGDFKIEDAVKISDIKENMQDYIITIEEFFKNKEKIQLDDRKLKLFLNGVNLCLQKKDETYKIYDSIGNFIGTGIIENEKIKRDIIL